jgi:Domain of unknown function (DUF5916)/Carbohydrate family 9 binding domain-like
LLKSNIESDICPIAFSTSNTHMYITVQKIAFTLLCLLVAAMASAQKKNEARQYHIARATGPIAIDGQIDEAAWQTAELATDFHMVLPMDTSRATLRTEIRMAYDNQFMYISAVCFQTHRIMIESLRRDWNFGRNDNFIFFMDPFDDQTNGFSFGANAAGAEWDGQQFDGGSVNLNWDNRWFSKVKRYADRWVFEAAIPFRTLRYKAGIDRWGINFSRNDLTTTEKSAWAPVPRQFPTSSLAYSGVLVWDVAPPKPGPNISAIPYVLGGVSKSYQPEQDPKFKRNIGGDAKVAITSSVSLDLTANPDFSQVEVDRQVTNLDRFELFFPERRQFFLENSDLFNNLGYGTLRPFFSRRIGLNTQMQYGARLSGRLTKDWRIGLLNAQTAATNDGKTPVQNFAVATVQRRVFSRSNLIGFLVNRQAINAVNGAAASPAFNRNAGLEFNLASKTEVWRGKFLYFKSFGPQKTTRDYAASGFLRYNNRKLNFDIQQEYIGDNYNPEVGFVPRRGFYKTSVNAGYNFFPKSGPILTHSPGVSAFTFFGSNWGRTVENEIALFYNINLRTRANFTAWTGINYIDLLAPFDPTQRNGTLLPSGTKHDWRSWGTIFSSKPQALFTYGFETRYGGYFADGTRTRLSANMAYRVQPWGSLALSADYNDIRFPGDNIYGLTNARFWLISPRLDVTLTKSLYFTAFLQYNEQTDNVNLNTRFQWRYAPASDLFIVYTDNYLPEGFGVKNRAFVLKCNYWWNI